MALGAKDSCKRPPELGHPAPATPPPSIASSSSSRSASRNGCASAPSTCRTPTAVCNRSPPAPPPRSSTLFASSPPPTAASTRSAAASRANSSATLDARTIRSSEPARAHGRGAPQRGAATRLACLLRLGDRNADVASPTRSRNGYASYIAVPGSRGARTVLADLHEHCCGREMSPEVHRLMRPSRSGSRRSANTTSPG